MKTVKANNGTPAQAAQMIKDGNAQLAAAKKQVDAGKETLIAWLKESKEIDVAALEIGEMVNIQDVCIVEIAKQNRFDETAFRVAHPEMFAQFCREFPVKKFKPLV